MRATAAGWRGERKERVMSMRVLAAALAAAGMAHFGNAAVDARHVPERMDDFIWENENFGARAYGPKLARPAPEGEGLESSGFDVFNKAVPRILMAETLIKGAKGQINYHSFNGEAFDNYKVSRGRGCGGVGFLDAKGWYHEKNWRTCKVVEKTENRAVFELGYETCTLRGTIESGTHFCKFEVLPVEGKEIKGLAGPGLDISAARQHDGNLQIGLEDGYIANFEPKGVGGEKNANVCTAIVVPGGKAVLASDAMGCAYLMQGELPFTYYAGSAWSGTGKFKTAEEWHAHVKAFAKKVAKAAK